MSTSPSASSATATASSDRHKIGVDTITWECDYPHSDSTLAELARVGRPSSSRACPTTRSNKITHENAMRIYQFDPFSSIPRGQATVGALRALVTD